MVTGYCSRVTPDPANQPSGRFSPACANPLADCFCLADWTWQHWGGQAGGNVSSLHRSSMRIIYSAVRSPTTRCLVDAGLRAGGILKRRRQFAVN